MSRYTAKVTVDYYLEIDDDEITDEAAAEYWASHNYDQYPYTAEIYEIEITEEDEEEEEEDE